MESLTPVLPHCPISFLCLIATELPTGTDFLVPCREPGLNTRGQKTRLLSLSWREVLPKEDFHSTRTGSQAHCCSSPGKFQYLEQRLKKAKRYLVCTIAEGVLRSKLPRHGECSPSSSLDSQAVGFGPDTTGFMMCSRGARRILQNGSVSHDQSAWE